MKKDGVHKRLEENESRFLQKLVELAGSRSTGNDQGFIGKMIHEEKLKGQEEYASRVFFRHQRVVKTITDVGRVKLFFRRYPLKEYYKQNDLYESDYYQYHLEVYSHKIATFEDTLLILSNEILNLGFPEKKCKWTNKLFDKSLKEACFGAYAFQRYIKESLEDNKLLRNLNSHRAYFREEIFDREGAVVRLFDQLKSEEILEMPLGHLPFHSANKQIQQRRKEYIESFEKRKKWMERMVLYYLYEITPSFDETLERLELDPSLAST